MIETVKRPEVRIAVRVDPDLYDRIEKIADRKYEGRFSMAAREAFRLLVERDEDPEGQAA